MNDSVKNKLRTIGILFIIFCIFIVLANLLYPIGIHPKDCYKYYGVDCEITFKGNQSLSNISQILDENGITLTILYNRSSPDGSGKIVDYISFSYPSGSRKNITGNVYNLNSDNITIFLRYYTEDIMSYTDKSLEEVENLTLEQFILDKERFEPFVEHIISIFSVEFDTDPILVNYERFILHGILG